MSFDISLDLYKIFCTVVRTSNMSLAAKELYISQPAVSMAMRQLEDRLGKPLLLRSSKGIKTTTEGSILYEYLKQALGLIETAEKKYLELANLEKGEIKIGASDTLLSCYLMPYIEKFMQLYPDINIKITNKTTYETIKLLKSGYVDLGFINLPMEYENSIDVLECMEINDCIVGGPKYKSLATKGLKLEELEKYPLLALERDSNSRRYVDNFASKNGIVLSPNIELGSSDLLLRFASINLGLALVVREFSKDYFHALVEIPLMPTIPSRHIGLIKLKNVTLSYAGEKFADMIIKE